VPSAAAAAPVTSSGTAYAASDSALLRQARALLQRATGAGAERVPTSSAAVPACVRALPGPVPVLVDSGTTGHRPALLVVQADAGGRLVVTVLPRPCAAVDAARPLARASGPASG
jgi:hypothetical protein